VKRSKSETLKAIIIMKKQILFTLVTSISLLNSITLPSIAQTTPIAKPAPQTVSQDATIPQDVAIIISFPAAITVDAGQKQEFPLTVPLSQAIQDSQGNVIVPENTPVSIVLKPTKGGVQIIAQSLVIKGRIVKIKASSQMIPGTTITHKRANDKAVESGSIWGRIGGSALGAVSNGDPEQFDRGAMLGSAIGLVSGLRSAENTRVVQIPQSSVYVLSLESPISLASK
jgi:hypothetical protein